MNIPNALTLFRILMVPGFLIAVIYGHLVVAFSLFLLAVVTDLLDGFFARILDQRTPLGTYLDPVADKLLMTVSFVSLAVIKLLPAWLAVLVVAKDLFLSLGFAILYFSGQPVAVAPTLWGKQTTFLQAVAIGFALLFPVVGIGTKNLWPLFVATGVMTSFSGLHYIFKGSLSIPSQTGRNHASGKD